MMTKTPQNMPRLAARKKKSVIRVQEERQEQGGYICPIRTVFCGGVWYVGEIEGKPALQEAYEMGKRV